MEIWRGVAVIITVVRVTAEHTFSNLEPRRDVNGAIINAHDGQIVHENGTYYWYAAGYAACREFPGLDGCAGCNHRPLGPACGCGFEPETSVNLYTSPDLINWTPHGNVLPVHTRPNATSLFSPRALYNSHTNLWVLWYNYVPRYSYAVATSASPFGPFTTVDVQAGASFRYGNSTRIPPFVGVNAGVGDFSLFKDDDGTAYMMYSHDPAPDTSGGNGKLSVARLSDDYLRSTWNAQDETGEQIFMISGFEAPAMFKRNDVYYALTSAACCSCGGGGTVYVHRADLPLGNYSLQGVISFGSGKDTHTQGQQTTVTTVLGANGSKVFLWQGDRWQSAPDGLKAHDYQFWSPLTFGEDGSIEPMKWLDEFSLPVDMIHTHMILT